MPPARSTAVCRPPPVLEPYCAVCDVSYVVDGTTDPGVGTTGGYKLSLVNVPVAPVKIAFNRVAVAGAMIQKHDVNAENGEAGRLPE